MIHLKLACTLLPNHDLLNVTIPFGHELQVKRDGTLNDLFREIWGMDHPWQLEEEYDDYGTIDPQR